MAVPLASEIAKKKKDLEGFLSKLDEDGRMKEKGAVAMLRSAVRQTWMRAPNKLAALLLAMEPDLDPNTRTKWLYKCAICGERFKQADVEVDHVVGEHTFTRVEDFQNYWDKMLNVPVSGLQVLCVEDHSTKTYMERHAITWEEAVARKKIIAKLKQSTCDQKKELLKYGYKASEVSNAEKREACYIELFNKGEL